MLLFLEGGGGFCRLTNPHQSPHAVELGFKKLTGEYLRKICKYISMRTNHLATLEPCRFMNFQSIYPRRYEIAGRRGGGGGGEGYRQTKPSLPPRLILQVVACHIKLETFLWIVMRTRAHTCMGIIPNPNCTNKVDHQYKVLLNTTIPAQWRNVGKKKSMPPDHVLFRSLVISYKCPYQELGYFIHMSLLGAWLFHTNVLIRSLVISYKCP